MLLALPAFLAFALSFMNPEHMRRLFDERLGQMMIVVDRHAGHRVLLDQTGHQDRGVAVSLMLPSSGVHLWLAAGRGGVCAGGEPAGPSTTGCATWLVVSPMAPQANASSDRGCRRSSAWAIAAESSRGDLGKIQQRLVAGRIPQPGAVCLLGIRIGFALPCSRSARRRSSSAEHADGACGCGSGYVLPGMACSRGWRKRRQHRIRLWLPDALDLLVVSVEAGLGLDQAIQRVGEELAFAHPDLSDELRLVNLELRAGTAAPEALDNLAIAPASTI